MFEQPKKEYTKRYTIEKDSLDLGELYDTIKDFRKEQMMIVELTLNNDLIGITIENLDDSAWELSMMLNVANNIPRYLLESLIAAKEKAMEDKTSKVIIVNTILEKLGRTLCFINAEKEDFVNIYSKAAKELKDYNQSLQESENN